jgi:hypothetical protein
MARGLSNAANTSSSFIKTDTLSSFAFPSATTAALTASCGLTTGRM